MQCKNIIDMKDLLAVKSLRIWWQRILEKDIHASFLRMTVWDFFKLGLILTLIWQKNGNT